MDNINNNNNNKINPAVIMLTDILKYDGDHTLKFEVLKSNRDFINFHTLVTSAGKIPKNWVTTKNELIQEFMRTDKSSNRSHYEIKPNRRSQPYVVKSIALGIAMKINLQLFVAVVRVLDEFLGGKITTQDSLFAKEFCDTKVFQTPEEERLFINRMDCSTTMKDEEWRNVLDKAEKIGDWRLTGLIVPLLDEDVKKMNIVMDDSGKMLWSQHLAYISNQNRIRKNMTPLQVIEEKEFYEHRHRLRQEKTAKEREIAIKKGLKFYRGWPSDDIYAGGPRKFKIKV